MNNPNLAIPATLRGSDPGSFAQHTVTVRLPDIARRVLTENDWPSIVRQRLNTLIAEMPSAALRKLQDPDAPDQKEWDGYLKPYLGMNWLQAPWFVVEMYFFRRILEATGYYQVGGKTDPYDFQKRQGLIPVENGLRQLFTQTDAIRCDVSQSANDEKIMAHLFRAGVWANQADLSMWPATNGNSSGPTAKSDHREHLLADDSQKASRFVTGNKKGTSRIDIVLDNGGLELAHDLTLADFLLTSKQAGSVYLHAKPHPTYVSDATIADVSGMLAHLETTQTQSVQQLADRLRAHLVQGRLKLVDNYYWTSPLSGWEMPETMRRELSQADLIISKGDANYRRWLGDRHWAADTHLEKVLSYLPAPWLALRVLKANIIAGLLPGQAEEMDRYDPHWLYNGKWGIIQFQPTNRKQLQ